jgi:hypothetical protein
VAPLKLRTSREPSLIGGSPFRQEAGAVSPLPDGARFPLCRRSWLQMLPTSAALGSSRRPAPETESRITAQGHPHTIFERAIAHGNLLAAETTLRSEIPRPTLVDLLELTALIALKDSARHSRVAARWLQRWLDASANATIDDVALATTALQALGSRYHSQALSTLRAMAEAAGRRAH